MKLIMTIISNSDVKQVLAAIAENGFFATKVATSGQFLKDGHTAILIATTDEKVEKVQSIIKENVTKRIVKSQGVESTISGSLLKQAVDVEEYGAVALTINVEDFQKF